MKIIYLHLFLFFSLLSFSQVENIPCPRNQPVIAYHEKENAVFLYGGYCSEAKKRLSDLWKFDGRKWINISSKQAPTARSGHSMIYDKKRNRLLVFGGKNDDGGLMNDFWSWDGNNWEKINGIGPEARQSHKIVYNSNNGDVFLFGGSDINGKALNDTWIYRNEKWIKIKSDGAPPGRLQHTICYDQKRDKMILFGGFRRTDNGKIIYGDTWEWSSQQGWQQSANDLNMFRDHHAMVYDSKNEKTILFGGYNKGYLGDTWSWDGAKWEEIITDGPSARAGKPGFIFNSIDKALVLFGGWDKNNKPLMDFWLFNYRQKAWKRYIRHK